VLDTLQTSSAPEPNSDLALLHSPPRTNSNHSYTEALEATIDETGSAYSNSNKSNTIDDSQPEEEEEKEEEEDRFSLDLNNPLQG
jgi:hypothetical protein